MKPGETVARWHPVGYDPGRMSGPLHALGPVPQVRRRHPGRVVFEWWHGRTASWRAPRVTQLFMRYSEKNATYRWPWERHDAAEIRYVDRGRLICVTSRGRTPVDVGQLILIPPGEPHATESDPSRPANVLMIKFGSPGLLARLPGLGALTCRPVAVNTTQSRILSDLYECLRGGPVGAIGRPVLLVQLLLVSLADRDSAGTSAGGESVDGTGFASRVRTYVTARLGQRLSLSEIARGLGCSISRLAHEYRRETDETPHRLILRLRLECAKEFLRRPGTSVKQAAFAAGFSSPEGLWRTFRRVEGVTPRLYRRMLEGQLTAR